MSALIAIDPSTTCTGLAVFEGGKLVRTFALKGSKKLVLGDRCLALAHEAAGVVVPWQRMGGTIDVVSEWPQVYSDGDVDPNDLPAIAGIAVGAAVACHARSLVVYKPKEWTGTIPKKVDGKLLKKYVHTSPRAKRILSRLDEAEVVAFHNADTNDEIDAIGIGLHALGRGITQRHRVYPGAT